MKPRICRAGLLWPSPPRRARRTTARSGKAGKQRTKGCAKSRGAGRARRRHAVSCLGQSAAIFPKTKCSGRFQTVFPSDWGLLTSARQSPSVGLGADWLPKATEPKITADCAKLQSRNVMPRTNSMEGEWLWIIRGCVVSIRGNAPVKRRIPESRAGPWLRRRKRPARECASPALTFLKPTAGAAGKPRQQRTPGTR